MELLQSSYICLFTIITLGFLMGKISIKGISLDVSAVIFVALFFGHFGYVIPAEFQKIGLVLFLFTIGIQAGPGFFEAFKKHGRLLINLAMILVFSAGFVTWLSCSFFNIDLKIGAGLFTGALTSTPGLAAAIDSTQSPLASIGYGIAYPFGVIGVILFVRLLPKMLRSNIKDAEEKYEKEKLANFPEILKKNFIVENENVFGKSIGELRIRFMTQAVVSRVIRDGNAVPPSADTILQHGDIIKAVGTESALKRVSLLIGPETDEEFPLNTKYDVRSVLVTNKDAVGLSIGQMNLIGTYNATVTRIRRSGIDITPTPASKIQMGDKLVIASSRENLSQVINIFGNDDRKLSDTDFLPISLGIILGILVGKLNINIGNVSFSPGLSGGVLIISLILGRAGKTGPILWSMTGAANNMLRQLGLLFFLATVGTKAGSQMMETLNQYGWNLFYVGVIITLFPMIIATLYARFVKKMDILTLLGALTGSMTSTPGLAAIDPMTRTNAPAVAYATVYPIAMVCVIIVVQLLSAFS